MSELKFLGIKYGTDKASHGYCPYYELFLGGLRQFSLTLIELGVSNGASLRMWREWMPKAKIYGLDVNGFTGDQEAQGFKVITGHQEKQADLEILVQESGPFQIVIDDASHDAKDQLVSFNYLFPRLLSGGWYIIEDSFGIGSSLDLEAIARGDNDIEELHVSGNKGDMILFLKKR